MERSIVMKKMAQWVLLAGLTFSMSAVADEALTPTAAGAYAEGDFLGRTIWIPANYFNQLYFDVPAEFSFVPGQPVYVRIEYYDRGWGRLLVEYDSTGSDAYKDAEVHARSSRTGGEKFVYSYQMFESPRFDGRQTGGNDFRLKLQGTDGSWLVIASVVISATPFNDEKFQYAISRPWLLPNTEPVKDFTDNQTLVGKVMAGYQGWFATPNDFDDLGWRHWSRSQYRDPAPDIINIDMWPYLDEYQPEDIQRAGQMVHQDGRPAYLFSSRNPEVVQHHFRWMRKHNIDGVYLQRFVKKNSGGVNGNPEFVLDNVRKAAGKEGRVWAIEYDVSGLDGNEATRADITNQLSVITNDWNYLVNECGILDDPRYLHENGMPVLFIWGFGTRNNFSTAAEADPIISWFAAQDLYLIGGVAKGKIKDASWQPVLRKYDQLLEWMEYDLPDLIALRQQVEGFGMKMLPHAWPGFSWNNNKMTIFPYQYVARRSGDYYWGRIYNAINCGADQIFLGMFDEYDEATAIMPMSDNHPDIYVEVGGTNQWGHYIDNEGLDPFWHLRLSGAAHEILDGLRPLSADKPLESELTPVAYGGADATIYLGASNRVAGLIHTQPVDGLSEDGFIGKHDCRINSGSYLYFDIDSAFCLSNAAGQAATIEA